MKPALAQPRTSALVQAELEAFEAIVRRSTPAEPEDFGAEMQQLNNQKHLAELREELEQARRIEQAIAEGDVTIQVRADQGSFRVLILKMFGNLRHLFERGADQREKVIPGRREDK